MRAGLLGNQRAPSTAHISQRKSMFTRLGTRARDAAPAEGHTLTGNPSAHLMNMFAVCVLENTRSRNGAASRVRLRVSTSRAIMARTHYARAEAHTCAEASAICHERGIQALTLFTCLQYVCWRTHPDWESERSPHEHVCSMCAGEHTLAKRRRFSLVCTAACQGSLSARHSSQI